MILVLFILFSAFAAFCGLLIYGYRSRAHSAEARANRAEGALGEAQTRADGMAEIAREAIKISATVAKLNPDEVLPKSDLELTWTRDDIQKAAANYVPLVTTNCPACGVSIRHPREVYPTRCPAVDCGALITLPDDPLDADLIG